MLKKFALTLASVLLMVLLLQTVAMAAVLEVDTANSRFASDTWQNNVGGNEICPLINCIETTPTTGAANGGTDNNDIKRFTACLQAGSANIEGQLTFVNGGAVNNIVFPLKETAKIDSVTWKFNNGVRQYFLVFYTSMDGANWTEVNITENAKKVSVGVTYDEGGTLAGPSVECYATTPAGTADNDDILPITFKFAQTAEANYLRVAFYGNDGGSGNLDVSNPWASFNSLKIEGSAAVQEAAVEPAAPAQVQQTEAAPVAAAPVAAVTAPKTSDTGIMIFAAAALIGIIGSAVVAKKRNRVK